MEPIFQQDDMSDKELASTDHLNPILRWDTGSRNRDQPISSQQPAPEKLDAQVSLA